MKTKSLSETVCEIANKHIVDAQGVGYSYLSKEGADAIIDAVSSKNSVCELNLWGLSDKDKESNNDLKFREWLKPVMPETKKYVPICLKITNYTNSIQQVKLLGAKKNKDAENFNNHEGVIIENGYFKLSSEEIPFKAPCMLGYKQILEAICDMPFHCSNIIFVDYDDYPQIDEIDKDKSFLIDGKLPVPFYYDYGPYNGRCGLKYIPYDFAITSDTEISFPIHPQKKGNSITVYLFPYQGMPFLFGV